MELEPKLILSDRTKNIRALVDKAGKAEKSEDAMRFAQAALNAANAISVCFMAEASYPEPK